LIAQVGGFDEEAFPRGYGEENDLCMRAMNAGWRNVIAPAAFVFHHRNASFQGEKERLFAAGIGVIAKRYPDYAQRVRDAFSHPSMENLRECAKRAAAATAMTAAVETRVAVCTCASVASQVQCSNGERRFVALFFPGQMVLPKRNSMGEEWKVRISLTENWAKEFGIWLLTCGIDRVEVESSDNLSFDPTNVCRLFGIPLVSRAAANSQKAGEEWSD